MLKRFYFIIVLLIFFPKHTQAIQSAKFLPVQPKEVAVKVDTEPPVKVVENIQEKPVKDLPPVPVVFDLNLPLSVATERYKLLPVTDEMYDELLRRHGR